MEFSFRVFSDLRRPVLTGLLPGAILWATAQHLHAQTTGGAGAGGGGDAAQEDVQLSRLTVGDLAGEGAADRHGVTYERWDNVPGNGVSNSLRRPEKLGAPAIKGLVSSLEFPPNAGKAYGARVRGYFVAPRDGAIRFVISSDDNSELWVSPGADPFARRRAAWIAGDDHLGWTRPGETGRAPSQWTAPMQVKQGERYYFEAYHKQAAANDHFTIRMRYDGDKSPVPVPSESLRPWLGIATDADDDGLPDEWQRETGLAGREDAGAHADPDGDGVVNFDEFVSRTGPLDPSPVPGMLLWEAWYGLQGTQVADLTRTERFSGRPDQTAFVSGGSTPVITAGYCGSRLSGFLVPSESGEYQLGVAGDDSTELWFSDGESSHRKERIAFGTSWRPKGDWFLPPSQRSKPVTLEAGRSYYFEVIQKDGGPPGWAAIGWKKKDDKSFVEVAAAFLRSPGVPADDLNRDFLPDQWVTDLLSRFPETSRGKIVFTEQGDPDRDGLPNWLESRLQTSPFEKDQVIGTLIREWWLNVPGRSLAVARDSGVFLRRPSMLEISRGASSEAYTADWYASRLRGYVVAPVTGKYRFWVSGDDQAEFWLSSDSTKFRKRLSASVMPESWQGAGTQVHTKRQDWDARPGQESAEVELKAGESYFIELLLKDSGGDDHVALAWQHREEGEPVWSDRGLVDSDALLSFEGDEDDLDDDYLPDSWENQFGLDPKDNGLKDRAKQGEAGDHDGDRLTNREEFLLGTNPCAADTDGDGVSDYDEVKFYESDPTKKDASPPVKYAGLRLSSYEGAPGNWSVTSQGTLFSMSRRGAANFTFRVAEAGIYLVELQAVAQAGSGEAPPVPVIASIDGVESGRGEVTGETTTLRWFTPWIAEGEHQLTIDNRNVRVGVAMEILALSLYRHEGVDDDHNGIPDWLENLFLNHNGVDGSTASSPVSPLCLEGKSRLAGATRVSHAGGELVAKPGLAGFWYADVPLDPVADTPVTVVQEGGALRFARLLTWTTTNLLEASDEIRVRKGDSLKVNAVPSGTDGGSTTARILLDSVPVAEGTGSQTHVVTFDQAGTFVLHAATVSGTETLEADVTVKVYEADFGPDFNLATGSARIWNLPGVPHGLDLDCDPRLSLLDASAGSEEPRKVIARYAADESGSPRVLARLMPGGILAATTVNAFHIATASRTRDARLVDVLPDGTRVLEFSLLIDGVIPADLSIWLEFYVTDALFDNGDTRYHLTAADFDENGIARILVYKAPGSGVAEICHWIRSYEDGEPAPSGEDADDPAPVEGD